MLINARQRPAQLSQQRAVLANAPPKRTFIHLCDNNAVLNRRGGHF
ncbi:hypothetical protein D918_04322 [Trichuris suis]|nr:hypothetical protein D918_04322 [Trichuris suis]